MNLRNVNNWNMAAGGTAAAEGKHSYTKRVDGIGEYHISPITFSNGRHKGYLARFANVFGKVGNGGLWSSINADGSMGNLFGQTTTNLREALNRCELHRQANEQLAATGS